jgi:hypothetical protein
VGGMTTGAKNRRTRVAARLIAVLLPLTAIIAVPTAAHAANYCGTVIAAAPGGYTQIYGWGVVDNCSQAVQAETHLREDIPWAPDREVSNDIRPGVMYAFLQAAAYCFWTPGENHTYFIETRVRVNGSDQQKSRSGDWTIQYYCS